MYQFSIHPKKIHNYKNIQCTFSTFQNFKDDLKTVVCEKMIEEVTVKVTAEVKDIQTGRETVNMIYCLMENFKLGDYLKYTV